MEHFNLPVWLRGPEISKLKTAADSWWAHVEQWLHLPLQQLDAETCHPVVLQLLAYQRDVDRFATEPDTLFRKRVKFAIQNTQDSGTAAGFKRIFERFDLVLSHQIERDPEKDWDVITLVLGSSELTKDPDMGQFIIRQYGRTCRRYEFLLEDRLPGIWIPMMLADVDIQTHLLTPSPRVGVLVDRLPGIQVPIMLADVDIQTNIINQNGAA